MQLDCSLVPRLFTSFSVLLFRTYFIPPTCIWQNLNAYEESSMIGHILTVPPPPPSPTRYKDKSGDGMDLGHHNGHRTHPEHTSGLGRIDPKKLREEWRR